MQFEFSSILLSFVGYVKIAKSCIFKEHQRN